MKFVLATHNPNKIREMGAILGQFGVEVVSPKELGITVDVEETGSTFAENAMLKAKAICELAKLPAIADDSGLCVDGLGGRPGVYSARYSESGTDADNNAKLVREVRPLDEAGRQAHYSCAIVLARGGREVFSCEGICRGKIVTTPMGDGGFGYDPILMLPEYGKTSAEITMDEKNAISHRGKALRAMKKCLAEEIGE